MPKLPFVSEALGEQQIAALPGTRLGVRADAYDMGAGIGEAVGGVADGLAHAGYVATRAAVLGQQIEEQNEVLAAGRRLGDVRATWVERLRQRQEQAPAGAPDFTKGTLEEYDRETSELLTKAPFKSPKARAELEQGMQKLRADIYSDAVGFQSKAQHDKRVADLDAGLDQRLNAVLLRPELAPQLMAETERMVAASGLSAADQAKALKVYGEALTEAELRARIDRDPHGTLKRLQSEDIPGLAFESRLRLTSTAEAGVREREAEAERVRLRAERDEERRIRVLGRDVDFARNALAAGLTPEGLNELRDQVRGTELEPELAQAERMAGFASRIALAPLQDRVAAYEVEAGRPVGEEDVLRLRATQETIKADVSALKEGRGLHRARELGLVDGGPVDLTDAASVQQRLADAERAGAHFGQAVGLLTPEERAAEVERINGMSGEQRASYLAQVQQASGEAWPSLMRELGGQGGLDRKTQYLGVLSGRPDAAGLANAVSAGLDAKPDDLEVALKAQGWTKADLERAVLAELEEFRTTVGGTYSQGGTGAAAFLGDVTDTVSRTAMQLMLQGHSANEAIRRAASGLINDRYHFGDGYRIPRPSVGGDAYVERVEQGMDDTMAALAPDLLDPPGSMRDVPEDIRRETYLEHVRERGRWITLPDESGLLLIDETGNAVTVKGRPVIVKFGGIR